MKNDIKAVAFDLDGTLYPNYRLNIRLVPFALKNSRFLLGFQKARKILHSLTPADLAKASPPSDSSPPTPHSPLPTSYFYDKQAALLGKLLGVQPHIIKEKIEKQIYRGWEPHFQKIKLYPGVIETLEAFRSAGLKLGLLSDFPPETKLKNLGIDSYWDAVLCSERCGVLKPDALPFKKIANALGLVPRQILFVGNSLRYDVGGAKAAGMSAALIYRYPFKMGLSSLQKRVGGNADRLPNFIFKDYRQLCNFVLY